MGLVDPLQREGLLDLRPEPALVHEAAEDGKVLGLVLHHDPPRPLLLTEEPRDPREDAVEEWPGADERGDVDPAVVGQRRLAVLIGTVADGVEEDVPCARRSLGREEGNCNRQNPKPFIVAQ
jgi:hypothetical protein